MYVKEDSFFMSLYLWFYKIEGQVLYFSVQFVGTLGNVEQVQPSFNEILFNQIFLVIYF